MSLHPDPQIHLLECTLRDAGYSVRFQFTAEDAAVTALGLEGAGFRLIEIGHGLGLGASDHGHGVAAASDRQYLEAVSSVLTHALCGVFIIPGIGTLEDVALAARCGAGFIRVGMDVTQTHLAEPFIKRGLEHGLRVSANLMKTDALSPDEVLPRALQLAQWGAETIAVVDSAGGMLPDETRAYVGRLAGEIPARVGFHGHNNLQLALANTLAALEAGATVLDCTLRGMGRSAGNAATEALVFTLARMGRETGIDPHKLLEVGERMIAPLRPHREEGAMDYVLGYSRFHSGFLPMVQRVAGERGVEARRLVMAVAERERVTVNESLVREVAETLPLPSDAVALSLPSRHWPLPRSAPPPGDWQAQARAMAADIRSQAAKSGATALFAIAEAPHQRGEPPAFPFIRGDATKIIGNAEVERIEDAVAIAQAVAGEVEALMVDVGGGIHPPRALFHAVSQAVPKTRVLAYDDREAHLMATRILIEHLRPTLPAGEVVVAGLTGLGVRLARRLAANGETVRVWDQDSAAVAAMVKTGALSGGEFTGRILAVETLAQESTQPTALLIGAFARQPVTPLALVSRLAAGGMVLDAGVGSLSPEACAWCLEQEVTILRVDPRAGLLAEIDASLRMRTLLDRDFGRGTIAGVTVAAGGAFGARGTVILDSLRDPREVVGVANGTGSLLQGAELAPFHDAVEQVRRELIRRRLGE